MPRITVPIPSVIINTILYIKSDILYTSIIILRSQVEETGERCEVIQSMSDRLIFSTSLYTMDALEFFLRERGWALGREYYRLDGSVPAEVRQKWCREFNAPNNTTTKQVSHQSILI